MMAVWGWACRCMYSCVCVNLRGSSFFRHSGVLPAAPHGSQRRPGEAESACPFSLQGVSSPSNPRVCPCPAPPIHRSISNPPTHPSKNTILDASMSQQLGIRLSSPKVTAGAAAGFPRQRTHGDSTEWCHYCSEKSTQQPRTFSTPAGGPDSTVSAFDRGEISPPTPPAPFLSWLQDVRQQRKSLRPGDQM